MTFQQFMQALNPQALGQLGPVNQIGAPTQPVAPQAPTANAMPAVAPGANPLAQPAITQQPAMFANAVPQATQQAISPPTLASTLQKPAVGAASSAASSGALGAGASSLMDKLGPWAMALQYLDAANQAAQPREHSGGGGSYSPMGGTFL